MKNLNFKPGTVWTRDNLEIMRGLNSNTIDLIYLDPPFCSNENYSAPIGSEAAGAAFKDMWTLDDIDIIEHGELAERNPAIYEVIKASGITHGNAMKAYLIFMGLRLLEMERILKDTGSIYLHCDDTAVHYLKLIMDGIFGKDMYSNDIGWKRSQGKGDAKNKFGRVTDRILFYTNRIINVDEIQVPLDEEYVNKNYRNKDSRGIWRSVVLTAPGVSNGESGKPWKEYNPGKIGRHWGVPMTGKNAKFIAEHIPGYLTETSVHGRLELLDKHDFIHWSSKGTPNFKAYLEEDQSQAPNDLWNDIKAVGAKAKERCGYPTQKPVNLLERIIKASTDEGDVVFDPFCGCATTLVAADKLNRPWIGCDLSSLAVELVEKRFKRENPGQHHTFFTKKGKEWKCNAMTEPPKRTDGSQGICSKAELKRKLYGEQEGVCNGCEIHFPFKNMTMDHIVPTARGGQDIEENIQLLCNHCNSSKGKQTMAEWKASGE